MTLDEFRELTKDEDGGKDIVISILNEENQEFPEPFELLEVELDYNSIVELKVSLNTHHKWKS